MLVDRRADLGEMVQLRHVARDPLDGLPFPALGGEDVGGAAGGVDLGHGGLAEMTNDEIRIHESRTKDEFTNGALAR